MRLLRLEWLLLGLEWLLLGLKMWLRRLLLSLKLIGIASGALRSGWCHRLLEWIIGSLASARRLRLMLLRLGLEGRRRSKRRGTEWRARRNRWHGVCMLRRTRHSKIGYRLLLLNLWRGIEERVVLRGTGVGIGLTAHAALCLRRCLEEWVVAAVHGLRR